MEIDYGTKLKYFVCRWTFLKGSLSLNIVETWRRARQRPGGQTDQPGRPPELWVWGSPRPSRHQHRAPAGGVRNPNT